MEIDKGAAPGTYWLTGSQAFKLMELAQESLAGRVTILHMSGLSQHEIYGSGKCTPFTFRDVFYSSYLQTYIDRDVKEQVQLADPLLFRDFVHAAACRAGQMLNVHDIARDVGVSDDIFIRTDPAGNIKADKENPQRKLTARLLPLWLLTVQSAVATIMVQACMIQEGCCLCRSLHFLPKIKNFCSWLQRLDIFSGLCYTSAGRRNVL